MSDPKPQSFRNHASLDPSYHFYGGVALLVNLVLALFILYLSFHTQPVLAVWVVLLSITMILLFLKLRVYPLKIQDRIIRLEEKLRMEALLPEPLRHRIRELNEDQLIGLRFASDEEIPELVQMALDKQLNRKQIKERIQNWRPDHFRI